MTSSAGRLQHVFHRRSSPALCSLSSPEIDLNVSGRPASSHIGAPRRKLTIAQFRKVCILSPIFKQSFNQARTNVVDWSTRVVRTFRLLFYDLFLSPHSARRPIVDPRPLSQTRARVASYRVFYVRGLVNQSLLATSVYSHFAKRTCKLVYLSIDCYRRAWPWPNAYLCHRIFLPVSSDFNFKILIPFSQLSFANTVLRFASTHCCRCLRDNPYLCL